MNIQTFEKKIATIITPARLLIFLTVILIIALLVVFGVFIFYYKFHYGISDNNADWGTFGDFVGGTLNPILSFLGLIALLFTIFLQSKELESTRIELERAASAQENTEKVLAEQTKTQAIQQFEGTFFSLLEQHNKALENLSSPRGNERSILGDIKTNIFAYGIKDLTSAKVTFEQYNYLCGHYFRVLYQLLKFIATNCPNGKIGAEFEEDKIKSVPLSSEEKMYSSMVRAFLDYDTTQLLAINCFCEHKENDSYWKYKLLIDRYSFLEHMAFDTYGEEDVLLIQLKSFYSLQAFGNSDFLEETEATTPIKSA